MPAILAQKDLIILKLKRIIEDLFCEEDDLRVFLWRVIEELLEGGSDHLEVYLDDVSRTNVY